MSRGERKFLSYGRQMVDEDDIQSVVEVLRSDFLTQGSCVEEFEKNLAEYVGSKYAVVCSSGTAALHLACKALDVSKESRVATSSITFVASANCAQYVNAETVFIDIQPDTYCMSVSDLSRVLGGTKINVVIPVHFAGHSADMRAIHDLGKRHGFRIIEDSCHALGGDYEGAKVGSCEYSDMCTFSFHPVKAITTGEGGAVTTNNRELYERLLSLRAHGIQKSEDQFVNLDLAFDGEGEKNIWYYEMPQVGFNYRLTDIQCALGNSQLRKLDFFIARRRSIAKYYTEEFKENQFITTPIERNDTKHAYHIYVILVDFKRLGKSRNGVMKELRELGISTQVLYVPVHLQPYYKEKYGTNLGDCPISENYYESCVSIPMFPSLQNDEMTYIAESVNAVIS